jgi:SsrA-binding protein
MRAEAERTVVANRRARHDYHLEETYEAGIQLVGSEVKSLREGRASLQDAYAKVRGGEVWLVNMHIAPYPQAGPFNHDPLRARKLLLHKAEIRRLVGKVKERGYTLVPRRVYCRRGLEREDLARREAERQVARALAGRRRPARVG